MKISKRLDSSVLEDIRSNLGLEPDDKSEDRKIDKMKARELFDRWLTWNNLPGHCDDIVWALREILEATGEGLEDMEFDA